MSRIYLDAAESLASVIQNKIRNKTYLSNNKAAALLYNQTLKYIFVLDEMFRDLKLLKFLRLNDKNKFIAVVMVYDLCFGQGRISGSGKLKKDIYKGHNKIKTWVARKKIRMGVINNEDLAPLEMKIIENSPIYARIILNSRNLTLEELEKSVGELQKTKLDFLPNLFVLNSAQLRDVLSTTDWAKKGLICVQDKASCFPVAASEFRGEFDVIDCCASPGNKTLQLASRIPIGSKSKVFAFEKDRRRFESLKSRVSETVFKDRIVCENKDFFEIDPQSKTFKNVKLVVVDPSCSGTGSIYRNKEQFVNYKRKNKETIEKEAKHYAELQSLLLCKAMQFESVSKVIYSTCSLTATENEEVVEKTLERHKAFRIMTVLPSWERRGEKEFKFGEKVVRTDPFKDETGGFFVAGFERVSKEKCGCCSDGDYLREIEFDVKEMRPLFEKEVIGEKTKKRKRRN